MLHTTRRSFLGGIGHGVLAAGLGTALGGRTALALGREADALYFGDLEPLVALMQETPPSRLQSILIEKLKAGTELRTLVAAASLANARTFGGQDYTGYHCMMALHPAYEMSKQLPDTLRPLPILKVIYRSATRIQEMGGRDDEALRDLPAPAAASREHAVRQLREAMLQHDVEAAEGAFALLSQGEPIDAYEDLQTILRENLDVHRVVLAWRAWESLELTGEQHARTLMRQSVRFCVDAEADRVSRGRPTPALRTLLPELIEQHELGRKPRETRAASDVEIEELSRIVFGSARADAAAAVAEALAAGVSTDDVGEALSLAANDLLLNDPGRTRAQPGKPVGSVHGASTGVHACDAARAWRNIAGVSSGTSAMASLITGAYHTAGQSQYVGESRFPYAEKVDEIGAQGSEELLRGARASLEEGDQKRACAHVERYVALGASERALLDLLLEYAVSEDGALHAEKYYRTVCEELATTRPAFRDRHLLALARVTASERGWPAPGLEEAREQLGA